MNRCPRNQHAQGCEEGGQHHQPHGNPVNSHVVMNVGARNPGLIDFELKTGKVAMQMNRQVQGGHECQDRNDEGKNFDVAVAARDQQQQQSAHRRNEGHQRKNHRVEACRVHRVPSSHSHPDHVGDHHRAAGGHPSGIRSQITRLHVASLVRKVARRICGIVNRRINHSLVHAMP